MKMIFVALTMFCVSLPASAQERPQVEVGANYWHTAGEIDWAFSLARSPYGDPTATIDWTGLSGPTGEAFTRIRLTSGFYLKAAAGQGSIRRGKMTDQDFYQSQYKWSDMSSKQVSGGQNYALADVGYAAHVNPSLEVVLFGGYHYWRRDVTGMGLVDNLYPGGTIFFQQYDDREVLKFEATWHALRLGGGARVTLTRRWTLDAEWAFVPKASMSNEDSHFLRVEEFGPTPNILSRSNQGSGRELETIVGYHLPKTTTISVGLRYWDLRTMEGVVEQGPVFVNIPLRLERARQLGLVLGVKKRF
jgi:hypothetical protein